MFSTCIFCNKPLGQNEALDAFPVGSRIAFDAARGRLWVVCRACERWNLSPLDERWEAVEQAEKLYRDTRRRVATDNIGLAKLRDGTTLVRIGEPLRPEFAAWRYGDQFGKRRTRAMLMAGGGVAAVGALVAGGAAAGIGLGSGWYMLSQVINTAVRGRANTIVAKVRTDDNRVLQVRRRHLGETSLALGDDGGLALRLRYKNGSAEFQGAEAARIAAIVVPTVNRYGGDKRTVAKAVDAIEYIGGPDRFLTHVADVSRVYTRHAQHAHPTTWSRWRRQLNSGSAKWQSYGLFSIPVEQRLALEMALHEEAERRAMDGELEELERAWRDAEEVAAIADNMFVPQSVDEQFRKLKGESS